MKLSDAILLVVCVPALLVLIITFSVGSRNHGGYQPNGKKNPPPPTTGPSTGRGSKPPRQMCRHNVPHDECYQCSMPTGGSYDVIPNLADPRFLDHPGKPGPRVYTEAEKQQIAFVDAYLARTKTPIPRPEPSKSVWTSSGHYAGVSEYAEAMRLKYTRPSRRAGHPLILPMNTKLEALPHHYRCAYCGRNNTNAVDNCPSCGAPVGPTLFHTTY